MYGWTMVSNVHRLLRAPLAVFHGNTFYPQGNTIAYSDLLLTPTVFPAGPVYLLTGNPVLQYNLTLLAWWALSAWAMYLLAFALLRSHPAAALAAVVFAFCPFRTDFYLEFQMQLAFPIPLAFLSLWRFLHGGRWRHALGMVAWVWVEALASMYYAIILGLALMAVWGLHVLLRPASWGWQPLGRLMVAGLTLALALAPFIMPYAQNLGELGLYRSLSQPRNHYADVLTYVATGPTRLYHFDPSGHIAETSLFMGFVALGLAVLACVLREPGLGASGTQRRLRWALTVATALTLLGFLLRLALHERLHDLWRHVGGPQSFLNVAIGLALARVGLEGWWAFRAGEGRSPLGDPELRWILLVLILVFFDLSLGPFIQSGRHEVGKGLYFHLYPYLIPLHAMRITSRIGVIVVLGVAILAGLGFRQLLARVRWPSARVAVTVLVIGTVLAEYAPFPLPYKRLDWEHPPAVYRVIATDPDDVAVLEWPQGYEDWDDYFTFMSINHWKRITNGASGFLPALTRDISTQLSRTDISPEPFPNTKARAYLLGIHPLRYVVVHNALLEPAEQQKWLRLREEPWAEYVGRFGTDDLYRLSGAMQGAQVDKLFSWDYARTRKEITFEARAIGPPAAARWIEVELNGRPLRSVDIGDDWQSVRVPLAGRLSHSAANVVTIRWRYEHPVGGESRVIGQTGVVAPADIQVMSGGTRHGLIASIRVNAVEYAPNERGYNVVALDPVSGQVRWARVFDTHRSPSDAKELADAVRALPDGAIVAVAVREDASEALTEDAVAALRSIGGREDIRPRRRVSHVLVGVKGAPPGTALERIGYERLEANVGNPRALTAVEIRNFTLR